MCTRQICGLWIIVACSGVVHATGSLAVLTRQLDPHMPAAMLVEHDYQEAIRDGRRDFQCSSAMAGKAFAIRMSAMNELEMWKARIDRDCH